MKTLKEKTTDKKDKNVENIGSFQKEDSCARHPRFLEKLKIPQPIAIDLSQKQHKGLAFLYGQGLRHSLHLKTWEKFDYFSTYALDSKGNMFLTPMPFISVKEKTFDFQKNIYKLDTNSGKLSVWMTLEDVHAGSNNPFGIISLAYDCDDHTLWVSAIDETSYKENAGVIYHIEIKTKKILQTLNGIDALTLQVVRSDKAKYLLVGNARKNELNALEIKAQKLSSKVLTLASLADSHEHIRKIKVRSKNVLELQSIPFSYTLIAETSQNDDRKYYDLKWNEGISSWTLSLR
ncbi:MAG: Unknown protein [uncultured Sulfurovum sp.]|uniref:Uncharacterized protein n=1 Tax=uncultured Sulfurovum sp. TaxID=269237 RepID=A0A6S6UH47_9BACT|nr:MAG: Unknown protein [uncultured Sulfurovum sp.]